MILNMPVNSGAISSTTSTHSQSEFTNFLKRKYSENENSHTISSTETTNYQESSATHNNNWKKRHIDSQDNRNYGIHPTTTYATTSSEEYNQQNGLQRPIETVSESGTGTFNIIANSSFINDLFEYDANLIVPVSVNSLSESDHPQFATPSSICVNSTNQYDDENNDDNWQATDLLELDHRYNSSLQTEITHLNPTVNLKPGEESSLVHTTQSHSPNINLQHQIHFLLPQKPSFQMVTKRLSSSSTTSSTSSTSTCSSSPYNQEHVEQDCDFEDKNLSWLLNFKFDEFPHLNPDITGANNVSAGASKNSKLQSTEGYSIITSTSTVSSSGKSTSVTAASPLVATNCTNGLVMSERSKSPRNSNKTGKKFEELVMEVTAEMDGSDMIVAENVIIEESSHRAPKKPPFTYTELIEYALEDKGELTVSGIYQWISDRFPYYKSNDDRWKNSVRHNLSINPHFRKGHKAPQGAGHLWTISSGDSAENVLAWEHKKQRLDLFFKMESMNRERLQQHQLQQQQQLQQSAAGGQQKHIGCQQDQCLYDEAAVAAAAIQQEMLQQSQSNNNNDATIQNQNSIHHHNNSSMDSTGHVMHELPYNDLLTDEELRKTAGQILNGIHREVEVQSVNHHQIIGTYQDVLLDNDYLNPIHKDVVVNESGLRHTSSSSAVSSHCHSSHSSSGPYYVTEIDPMELGIQMSTHHHHHVHDPSSAVTEESDVVLFNDEFNLNYFTYNPANDIVA